MSRTSLPSLGEFEQIVLLAILRLDEDAYSVTIRKEIRLCTGRNPAVGALYNTLDRLEEKGVVSSRMAAANPERAGRPKRLFAVTATGVEAVTRAQKAYQRLLQNLKLPGLAHA